MKYLFLLAYFANISFSYGNTIRPILHDFIPQKGIYIIAGDKYEDVRIDSDLDGKVDFWRIRDGSLIVEIYFNQKGSIDLYTVRSISNNSLTKEFAYRNVNGSLTLIHERLRSSGVYTYDESPSDLARECNERAIKIDKDLTSFTKEISDETNKSAIKNNLLDKSCSGREAHSIANKISVALSDKGISSCMKSGRLRKGFGLGADNDLKVKIIESSYLLQKKQLIQNNENYKSIFMCDRSQKEAAITKENGQIVFSLSSKEITLDVIEHELLHRSGIKSDDSIHQIQDICNGITKSKLMLEGATEKSSSSRLFGPSSSNIEQAGIESTKSQEAKIDPKTAKAVSTKNGSSASSSKAVTETSSNSSKSKNSYDGATAAAKSSTASIPKEMTVAQTNVPSNESISKDVYSPPQKTEEGLQAAYSKSVSQSSGVLRTANNLAGSMSSPATASETASSTPLASESSYESGSSYTSKRYQKREIAAYSAESKTKMGERVPAAEALGQNAKNFVGKDERIVESITLDDQKPAERNAQTVRNTNSAQRNSAGNSQTATQGTSAQQNIPSSSTAPSVGQTVPSESSGGFNAASVNPGTIGGNSSLPSLGSQGGQRQPASAPSRGPASTASSATTDNTSREEVITFISQGNYSSTKRKLKETSFNKQLEAQKITILDLYGNSYGAKKGEIIFLDQGDRFVRQK